MVKEILIYIQKIKCYSLWSKLPLNGPIFFAVNHDMQKLSFWKLSVERNFPGKKFMIKICDCTSSTFDWSPLTNAFENLALYMFVFF